MISAEIKAQAVAQGFAKSGDVGGQPKQTYWTPDGRQIRAMPDMHEYAKKNGKGEIIESGLRDANLDSGWLTSKPQVLQLYCNGCDMWHKTPQEVKECRAKKLASSRKWQHIAKKELKKESGDDGRIDRLESAVSELTVMMKKLLEKN